MKRWSDKEFYKTFWEELKQPFTNSLNQAKVSKKLVTSQRQAIIKLLEKKDKDKRLISNRRPISLLKLVSYFSLFSKGQYVSWLFRTKYFEIKYNLQLFYLLIVSRAFILS